MESATSLTDRCIAVPESRQLDLFAHMLERRGARVLRCPLVHIRDAPDPAPIQAWLAEFANGGCDDLILLTGEGLRRLLDAATRADGDLHERFVARLAQVRKITRGPKPQRVLRELKLRSDLAALAPTTDGVIRTLAQHDLRGRRVGVQLYGDDPNAKLIAYLRSAGARPLPVAPYRYADQAEDPQVIELITALIDARIDAIAFTSSPQVRRLFSVARRQKLDAALGAALAHTVVAAVGPLVAETLTQRDVRVDLMPTSSYFMKPLVRALSAHFQSSH